VKTVDRFQVILGLNMQNVIFRKLLLKINIFIFSTEKAECILYSIIYTHAKNVIITFQIVDATVHIYAFVKFSVFLYLI
jgi:hypothetical protein